MYRIPYENEQITKTIAAPYAPVDFTEEEKEQFRENIGAWSGAGGGRNLLDNGWFTVNQRNATTVSGDSYGVDRWLGRYEVIPNGVALVSGAYRYAEQRLGEPNKLNGKEVTLSIKSNGVIHTKTFTFNNTRIVCTLTNNTPSWNISENATPRVLFQSNGEIRHEIEATKLEIGSVSTLANDSPPDYATELLKCQRYFYCINSANVTFPIGPALCNTSAQSRVIIQTPINMRAVPTVTLSTTNQFAIYANGELYRTVTGISASAVTGSAIACIVSGSNFPAISVGLFASTAANEKISFSADL